MHGVRRDGIAERRANAELQRAAEIARQDCIDVIEHRAPGRQEHRVSIHQAHAKSAREVRSGERGRESRWKKSLKNLGTHPAATLLVANARSADLRSRKKTSSTDEVVGWNARGA